MLIHNLKVSGLLSFGPKGIDLPMEPLNVLIGPNGSGKSNFLEVISLLKASSRSISEPFSRDGIREWLWKGEEAPNRIAIEAMVHYPRGGKLRHSLVLTDQGGRPVVADEQIEPQEVHSNEKDAMSYYRPPKNKAVAEFMAMPSSEISDKLENLHTGKRKNVPLPIPTSMKSVVKPVIEFSGTFYPDESLLSCAASTNYPALWHLQEQYKQIRLYRDWSLGPSVALRQNQSAHDRTDFLNEDGSNLALVISNLQGEDKRRFIAASQDIFDGIIDITSPVIHGHTSVFLEEYSGRQIPASRLSDGTLRYLCLSAILLHPNPPPLIAIEEPELGLHPDLLPKLSDLLLNASERSQLIVTTHSDVLVDSLTENPETVVVCEQHEGQTEMHRLDKDRLAKWLEDYTLGNLWTSGELGGNRW